MTMERISAQPEVKEITFREVKALMEPLDRIIQKAEPEINAGAYEVIIGDDASGRIPALILDRFLRLRYAKSGHSLQPSRFIAGAGSLGSEISSSELANKSEAIRSFLKTFTISDGRKALVVTDAIVSGRSLAPLLSALREMGVSFDVATAGADPSGKAASGGLEKMYGCKVFSGGYNVWLPVFGAHHLAGVEKDIKDLHARPFRESENWSNPRTQEGINAVRGDVQTAAEILNKEYEDRINPW